ncbi:hypothetical protein LX83_001439 [Goodfellowiella coeruleoviolacea]|uniref:Uncharacterized protein n=1 Tax=Goodfellowiella coeruleoviolacea TaxID=334858 RepID=A0AAE3KFN5_9PSEU|nr:hypothetical protein [Goodfellowiella coeruleoviolacea]
MATSLFVVGGLVMVLVAMAQARDRKGSRHADVVRTGLIGLGVIAVLALLQATVFPSTLAWALVAALAIAVLTLTVVD